MATTFRREPVPTLRDLPKRAWRSATTTKALLFAGIVAAGLYVVGDVVSGLVYKTYRPYSFRDQWISELTATGSPVRPLMVSVITIHDLLLIAFGAGIWRAAGRTRSLRWMGLILIAGTAFGLVIHPFFPMASRWNFTDTPVHGTLSLVWSLVIAVAVVLSAVAYRGWFRLYSISTVLVMIGFGTASGIAIRGIERNHTPWAGGFERINAYALMAWIVVLAVTVMRRSRTRVTLEKGLPRVPDTTAKVAGSPMVARMRDALRFLGVLVTAVVSGRPVRPRGDEATRSLPGDGPWRHQAASSSSSGWSGSRSGRRPPAGRLLGKW
jgi:hypothetical protein